MIALSGADSVLARHILPVLRGACQVYAFDSPEGDIGDVDFLKHFIDEVRPGIFVNCSEFSDIEKCEFSRGSTYEKNAFSVGQLSRLCAERDILLVHFSSSFVFDGETSTPYNEDDVPRPVQAYGDSKLLSETLILESGCRHLLLRVPHVIGSGYSFLHKLLRELRDNGNLTIIRGLTVSPLYAEDAANYLLSLINEGSEGLFHLGSSGIVDMASFIAEARGLYHAKTGIVLPGIVVEADYDDYPSPVDYPRNNTLSTGKFSRITGIQPPQWNDALACFIESWSHEI